MNDLDIAVLRTFVAIVETGGLTSAGRVVGRTQSAVTHQINRLEAQLGRPVFGPRRRRVTLTADGEILLDYARAMLRLTEDAKARFTAPSIAGRVTLGTPDLYAAFLLPGVLSGFSRTYPQVALELRCSRSVNLYAALDREEIDIALMTRQPQFDAGTTVRAEPLVWVAARDCPVDAAGPLPLALLPEGSVYRQRALDALGHVGRLWTVAAVSDSIAGLQAAVHAGLAVSVFPLCALSPQVRRLGRAEGLPDMPDLEIVLHRKPSDLAPAAEHLAQYIFKELGPLR